ncbi:MAG: MerR family transcriptional regulator [Coriobacteriaceae bacterium]|nr:MerR family transcriptional regulator [Coriobacteriaceae bacterium]
MRDCETTQGWKISQVERLIDLPRRDIQRACYDGQGGACILEPANSTWGKRFYSASDIARLMLVKLYKDQGYCLPEIRDLLNGPDGHASTKAELAIWKARLEEELIEVELKLNRVVALLATLRNDSSEHVDASEKHLRNQLPNDVIETLRDILFKENAPRPSQQIIQSLISQLDKPGIDLAIDLWAGPGSYDRLVDEIWNTSQPD